jgi:hypothetical protein
MRFLPRRSPVSSNRLRKFKRSYPTRALQYTFRHICKTERTKSNQSHTIYSESTLQPTTRMKNSQEPISKLVLLAMSHLISRILGGLPLSVNAGMCAKRGRLEDLRDILAQVPDAPALPGDEV